MTKRILAALLALAMALSLCSFEVFAADSPEMTEEYTYTFKDKEDGGWHSLNKQWHVDEFAKLLAALEKEGSVVNISYDGDIDWGIQIGFKNCDVASDNCVTAENVTSDKTNKTATVSGKDLLAAMQTAVELSAKTLEEVKSGEFYVNTGHSEKHNLTFSISVPASTSTTPTTGTTVELNKSTWNGGKDGNFQLNIPLDDVNEADASKLESFKVELTATAIEIDGKQVAVSNLKADIAQNNPWKAAALYKSANSAGKLTLEVTADKLESLGASKNWVIQIYVDNYGEGVNIADVTSIKVTYTDFAVTLVSKECKHENIKDSDWEDSGDGKTHTATCPDCGEEVSEKHTYENGICTKCKAVKPESEKKKTNYPGYVVQLGEEYHGFFMGGFMITMPHTFVGDECTQCGYIRPAAVEEAPAESAE